MGHIRQTENIIDLLGAPGVSLHISAEALGMSNEQLAATAGFVSNDIVGLDSALSLTAQEQLREMLEIIARVTAWAGGARQAMAWYRAEPLPAFDGRTAQALVNRARRARFAITSTISRSADLLEVYQDRLSRS